MRGRSAKTGKFVTKNYVKNNPDTTITEKKTKRCNSPLGKIRKKFIKLSDFLKEHKEHSFALNIERKHQYYFVLSIECTTCCILSFLVFDLREK